MFEVKPLLGDTFYFEAFTNVGIYRLNEKQAVLIDSCDHKRMVRSLDRELEAMELEPSLIINTHCHNDHICGNRYFSEKYGCRLLSTKLEQAFIHKPELEIEFYSSGLMTDERNNPFLGMEPSEAELISKENIPEGFEIIELPGHAFEMVGVRTPDDVLFLADAVLSVPTWEGYKLPFFCDVNESVKTLERIRNMKARLFVPSHNAPVEDISELAEYNIAKLKEKKQMFLELCDKRSFEEIFAAYMEKDGLVIKTPKYCMYAVMVRKYLQSLIDDGLIYNSLENNIMRYHIK